MRFACDAVDEGLLNPNEAFATVDAGLVGTLLHPMFDPEAEFEVLVTGVAASPGAAKGSIVFTAEDASRAADEGRKVVLVRPFTDAADVAGFHAAEGILTSEGGKASHAALVARGMGLPAVTGASDLRVDVHGRELRVGGTTLRENDLIAIDGSSGRVTVEDVPLVEPAISSELKRVPCQARLKTGPLPPVENWSTPDEVDPPAEPRRRRGGGGGSAKL